MFSRFSAAVAGETPAVPEAASPRSSPVNRARWLTPNALPYRRRSGRDALPALSLACPEFIEGSKGGPRKTRAPWRKANFAGEASRQTRQRKRRAPFSGPPLSKKSALSPVIGTGIPSWVHRRKSGRASLRTSNKSAGCLCNRTNRSKSKPARRQPPFRASNARWPSFVPRA